jgi:hypothetical protein
MENSTGALQKSKNRTALDPAIPLLGIFPKKVKL